MRAGRKIKTHTASYDSKLHMPGLSRQGKRRRVVQDDKEVRFTEPDERTAIERAKKLLGIDSTLKTVALTAFTATEGQVDVFREAIKAKGKQQIRISVPVNVADPETPQ
jgi:hypothetical protein